MRLVTKVAWAVDTVTHKVTTPYCNAKVRGRHLPGWGYVQVWQWHLCNGVERLSGYMDPRYDKLMKVLYAAHRAADELDEWDGNPSPVLGGASPGGVVRHEVHKAFDGDPFGHECPVCKAEAAIAAAEVGDDD